MLGLLARLSSLPFDLFERSFFYNSISDYQKKNKTRAPKVSYKSGNCILKLLNNLLKTIHYEKLIDFRLRLEDFIYHITCKLTCFVKKM